MLQPARPQEAGAGRLNHFTESIDPRLSRFRYVTFADSLRGARRSADFTPVVSSPLPPEPYVEARPEDDAFVRWLLERIGLDGSKYRLDTLRRRLPSVLRGLRVESSYEARRVLQRDLSLLSSAVSSAIIGVTSFFREPQVFNLIGSRILPLAPGRSLRVWSLGCSDGAELYSMAILLDEIGRLDGSELLGTDCRLEAILAACRGSYSTLSIKEVPRRWRGRYFGPEPPSWRIVERLRSAATWRLGNALAYVEPGPWDVILCRNLAIYLQNDAISALWRRLMAALRPGGILVVGNAERPSEGESLVMVGPCVYRRESI